ESITDYISNKTIRPNLLDKLGNKYDDFDKLIESKNKKDMKDAIKILDEIKVLDPTCGSGAFLIKASEVILGLKRRLYYELKDKKNFYDLKLDIITENIYGVDILAGAIEISKLRLWLWLISDFEESKNEIKALPNIEYNLKVGNSLIGWLDEKLVQMPMNTPLTEKVDGIFTGLIAFSENGDGEKLKKARELLRAYKLNDYIEAYYILYKVYRRTHGLKAENLRSILETIRKSIYASVTPAFLEYVNKKIKPKYDTKKPPITIEQFGELQVFHWRIDFGHIILNGGFDVVIGNPPYFSITNYTKQEKDIVFNTNPEFLNGDFAGKIDVYSFFVNRSIKGLLKDNSLFSFIIPKTILSNVSFSVLRKIILDNYKIKELVDLEKVFSEVTGTMTYLLLFLQKSKPIKKYNLELNTLDLSGNIIKSIVSVDMLNRPPLFIWVMSKIKLELLNKIEQNSTPLKELFITKNGVCTGDNDRYLSEKKINSDYKLIYVAKDIAQYKIRIPKHYVLYDRDLLHRPREEGIFTKPKILAQMIRGLNTKYSLICALDETNYLALNNLNIIRKKDENSNIIALLGFLNSKVINYFFKNSITDVNIKTVYIDIVPLKFNDKKILREIESYAEGLIRNPEDNTKRAKLDKILYDLYELNKEDIALIEAEFEDFSEKK
ncbi:MAG: TaqI-like C-terminal specificity domain-containing protein, partial [Nanoarchaeota archaeon]|nr:TaqI-like C-terminal specificity domain-containing protein [Nanoarchaeota archaeon]